MSGTSTNIVRRSFLSRLGVGATALGIGVAAIVPGAAQTRNGFQPRRHDQDAWLDASKGVHRVIIDSASPDGGGSALLFAANTFIANKAGYNLDPPDVAVVVVFRHDSTPFAYTDAMWAKYGAEFSDLMNFKDPKTKAAPTVNLYNAAGYDTLLPNFGNTIASLLEKNVQFAVCNLATHFFAGAIADKTKTNADSVYRELAANLIPNSHLVAAGVLGVNRAQEYGYTLLFAG